MTNNENSLTKLTEQNPCGVVVNMLDCDIIASEFKHQSHYYIHF